MAKASKAAKSSKAVKSSKAAKTSLGIDENLEALLCYVLGWVTGVVFLIIEKKSKFVKFHALQSTITFLSIMVLSWIFGNIPFVGWLIGILLSLISLVLWILLMIKAYQGEKYKLPIIGNIAEQHSK